jgi:RNA polymerase sigma-70 factor (ECF subfamily)
VNAGDDLDNELVLRRALRGNRRAFAQLMQAQGDYLSRTAHLYLASETDVQDAISATVLAAMRGIKNVRESAQFRSWLTRILIRQCYQRYAQKAAETDDAALVAMPVASRGATSEEKLDLLAGLRQLNDANRQVLLMYYYNDLSVRAIAELTGQGESTVKSQLRRGRRQLKEWLGGDYFED